MYDISKTCMGVPNRRYSCGESERRYTEGSIAFDGHQKDSSWDKVRYRFSREFIPQEARRNDTPSKCNKISSDTDRLI